MADDDVFENVPDVGEDLARAEQRLTVRVERRTYNKPVTVVEGFDPDAVDVRDIGTQLKKRLGAGGTVKDTSVEVQGDHEDRVRDILTEMGFAVED
ncbi:stress response translation initiation inhibitor YciH [Halocalculus aciditolerans]|uniref:Protein translation factor SUI1 homolog n=1 Tax=Halocalculus aciditolerans TaxID=1383812 RepID=A0A830F0M0_9EURY|nr:stress response translation initiation inhibitor YciH [Halocalculus aciditolerans]GGL49674.1 translation initiation factor [Halocalculus aciditolerans]